MSVHATLQGFDTGEGGGGGTSLQVSSWGELLGSGTQASAAAGLCSAPAATASPVGTAHRVTAVSPSPLPVQHLGAVASCRHQVRAPHC